MSDPIDISIKDDIDSGVERKIESIGKTAVKTHQSIEDLKAALKGLNTSALKDLQRASASNATALAKEVQAQATAIASRERSAIADAKAALEKQKLATESARTAAAEANAARAATQSEAAALRLAAAQERAANAKSAAQKEAERFTSSINNLKASLDPLNATLDRQQNEVRMLAQAHAQGSLSDAEHARYQKLLETQIEQTTNAIRMQEIAAAKGIQNAKAMQMAGLNMSRQFADIGVTAAMGMNPLMILIQQGPQIADTFQMMKMEGIGFKDVLKGIIPAGLGTALAVLAVVLGVAAGAFGLFHRELSKGYPDDITKGMNLTEEQLERVTKKTVSFGDTFVATFVVIGQRIMESPIGDFFRWIGDVASDVMDYIAENVVWGMAIVEGTFRGTLKTVLETWRLWPKAFIEIFITGLNGALSALNDFVTEYRGVLNTMIAVFNVMSPVNIPLIPDDLKIGQIKNKYEGTSLEIAQTWGENITEGVLGTKKAFDEFGNDVSAEALRRARAQAQEQAGKPNKTGAGSKSSGKSDEEKRAEALAELNSELAEERRLMGLVGDELANESRMSSIVQGLQRKGIALSEGETSALRAKVTELTQLAKVQEHLESIYDDVHGAQETFDNAMTAAKQLLDGGRISAEQYAEQVARIGYEHRMATDPLAAFNDELENEGALIGKFGTQLSVATRMQSLMNDLRAKGKKLTDEQTASLEAQLTQRERELMINQELASIYEANQGAVDQLAARQAALGIAYQQGAIGAEQYRIGLNNIAMEAANVAIRQTEMATTGQMALASLQSYMASYQGMLPGITQSFGNFFTTVADGFANSIARSIVYAEDFGQAMQDVARQALTELIASLIKLGIQWVITQAIGTAMGTATTAASAAQGLAVAAAWAPAAAAVSLATMGANAIPAAAGMTSTYALAGILSAIPGFKDGGHISGPGGPRGDKIPAMLSDGEFVVNADATRNNRALLEAINSGRALPIAHRAEGGIVATTPSPSFRPSSGTSNITSGVNVSVDMSGSNFGNNDPDELEDRFMEVVATQLAPKLLEVARQQANEDMSNRFERPRI